MKKSKVTRDQYERSKKVLDRWESKVFKAKSLVKHWEGVEAKNKDRIGKNVLMAIVTDETGSKIHFESPIHLAKIEDESDAPVT